MPVRILTVLLLDRREYLLRADRQLADAHADGVVNGVGDGGGHRDQRRLAESLGAVRATGSGRSMSTASMGVEEIGNLE